MNSISFIHILLNIFSSRSTAQRCLDHPWLRGGSSIDTTPSLIHCCPQQDSSTLFTNSSTVVPDEEDQTDVRNVFLVDKTVVDYPSSPWVFCCALL